MSEIEIIKQAIRNSKAIIPAYSDGRERGLVYYASVGMDTFGISGNEEHERAIDAVLEAAAKAVLSITHKKEGEDGRAS